MTSKIHMVIFHLSDGVTEFGLYSSKDKANQAQSEMAKHHDSMEILNEEEGDINGFTDIFEMEIDGDWKRHTTDIMTN